MTDFLICAVEIIFLTFIVRTKPTDVAERCGRCDEKSHPGDQSERGVLPHRGQSPKLLAFLCQRVKEIISRSQKG